ncbi:hypothetical protein ACFT7S_28385 [Streptomyces sp. NPDC057136]|uniref:hypothetical protein n=1 Tax=Streptomyces sp. NPDC057136 TaxID=3346029 RepID=UPI00362F802A
MKHLTHSRITAALAAATQPEGERPWTLLLTRPPMTYTDSYRWRVLEQNPDLREFAGIDEPTCRAEASRARIVTELARRDAYMDALATSEQMMSTTPALPIHTTIRLAEWHEGPLICWVFHQSPEAVHEFAAHFGGTVTEGRNGDESPFIRVGATGTVNGIQFEAYTLVDAASEQVAA